MIYQRKSLAILTAIAAIAFSGASSADNIIGSTGSWQTWTTLGLNNDGSPYWDVIWGSSLGGYGGNLTPASKNVGFCLTSTGDCQGIGSGEFAPGTLSFWGGSYNSTGDTDLNDPSHPSYTGGARDNKVYFHSSGEKLKATLFLNSSIYANEINEFGWFETNATGTKLGRRHMLFQGTGDNQGTLTPDPVGKTIVFKPSTYYGYYYNDVSEQTDLINPPANHGFGCYAYTLWGFTEARCLESGGSQGDHDLVVFKEDTKSNNTNYWIAAEDPTHCQNQDADCNLTVVKVSPDTTTP
jgi:hypothetical protein